MFKARGLAAIVLGLSAAAFMMVTGLASARADELSDLRVNQQLLQDRLDQLAQQPGQSPFPTNAPPGTPVISGSFPRSFLLPGTDTSLRIGGDAAGQVVYFVRGMPPNGALNGQGGNTQTCLDGEAATCTLAVMPLKAIGQLTGPGVVINASA